jgi:hypothetical protein
MSPVTRKMLVALSRDKPRRIEHDRVVGPGHAGPDLGQIDGSRLLWMDPGSRQSGAVLCTLGVISVMPPES